MEYNIVDGKVQTRALEYHVVDHCNLRCDHCCSFSPILKKWTADPLEFEHDLRVVRRVLAPQYLKLVGGEPLLHPDLERLLAVARELAVGRKLQLTTNGFLLNRLSSRAWDYLDILTVSLYPEPFLPKAQIRFIAQEARSRNIEVSWKMQDKFSCLDRAEVADAVEAERTFADCWIRHRCHSIKRGRFYSCTRPQYVQKFATDRAKYLDDGIDVNDPDAAALAGRVRQYLQRTEPLATCFLCNGGQASLHSHCQLNAREVQSKREHMVTLSGIAPAPQ